MIPLFPACGCSGAGPSPEITFLLISTYIDPTLEIPHFESIVTGKMFGSVPVAGVRVAISLGDLFFGKPQATSWHTQPWIPPITTSGWAGLFQFSGSFAPPALRCYPFQVNRSPLRSFSWCFFPDQCTVSGNLIPFPGQVNTVRMRGRCRSNNQFF